MTFLRFAAVFVAALVGTAIFGVQAQADEGLLRGVKRVDPFVLPLDKDSATCGIEDSLVKQVLTEAAADAPFSLDGREYVLFVRLSSLPKQGECFSSIDLGVYWEGRVTLPGNTSAARAKVKLWENGTILISPRSQHWREVAAILKHLVGNLESAWRTDNSGSG
ncbi:MAG: hypothetical protein OEN55_11580 [Alphaproteobacteria bacterium]|nr:hypothetical protein [Alphaproteobacteria bacterium]